MTMAELNLYSYNVKGLDRYEKRSDVFLWLKQREFDIILLQETHSSRSKAKSWIKEWNGNILYSHGKTNSTGVCILFKKDLVYDVLCTKRDRDGRILIIDIVIKGIRYSICNLYAPNDDVPEFFNTVFNMLLELDNENMIIGGDYNLVLNINMDKKGGRPVTHDKCKSCLESWMKELELIDIWRKTHPIKFQYTWKSYSKPFIYCRLDFFLLSFGLTSISKNNNIKPGFRSDHNIVHTTLILEKEKRGPGFWKLNCDLLTNNTYKEAIIHCIEECKTDNPGTEKSLLWETTKCRIRGSSIKFSAKLKRERLAHKKALETELDKLKTELPFLCNKEENICARDISIIEHKLENIIKKENDGVKIRSKCLNYEQGEKSTRYFHSLEKRNQENKNIKLLYDEKGCAITGTKNIMDMEVKYYKELYKSSTNKHNKHNCKDSHNLFFNNDDMEFKNIDDISDLLDEQKLWETINSFACNKSPGSDGLPIEFYKAFWPYIKDLLMANYNDIWNTGELKITQKQGVITLIPKKDKNPAYLKNWRPITLLNCDYKILTKYLANYLKEYLDDIINVNQKGFLSSRYIGENINNATAIIDHCIKKDIDAVLLFLDFNKAFDCVEWNMIHDALDYFGFKGNIKKWINIIYNVCESCIINNGHISPFFALERGLRQGCPLSPYLFILVVELLSIYIRKNKKIQGISLGKHVSKVHQYADDTFITTLNNKECIAEIFKAISKFGEISGLQLNKDKTEVLHLGRGKCVDNIKKSWIKDEVTLLGIKLSINNYTMSTNNYDNKLIKVKNCLNVWQGRDLSLIGRIHIIKSLASSQLVYCWSNIMSPNEDFFKSMESTLYKFLWNSSVDRIKRKIIIGPYDQGGLKMVDIKTQDQACKLKWINLLLKRLNTGGDDIWCEWVTSYLPDADPAYFFKCNISPKDISKIVKFPKNSLWEQIMHIWCTLNYDFYIINHYDIQNQSIWFNSMVKVNNKVIFYKKWYEHNIRYIKDLLMNGKWITPAELYTKFGLKINYLDLYSILSALPSYWKGCIKEIYKDEYIHNIDRWSFTCKESYNLILKSKVEIPEEYVTYWENVLNTEIDCWDWIEGYSECQKWTISTKLRSFYYQLRMKDIMCNVKLCKMGKMTDEICEWCNKEKQDIMHLFWHCEYTQKIWEYLTNWINEHLKCELAIKVELIFLYDIEAGNLTNIINLLILICCRYIYVCKCIGKIPNVYGLINKIKDIENIERITACKDGHLAKHLKKWSLLSCI